MGGPRVPEDVEPFLERLFADPDIIRLPRLLRPFQPRLARAVARRRAPSIREKYRRTGATGTSSLPEALLARSATGGSPLCATTERLAERVEKELAARGAWSPVAPCFRYIDPGADATLDALARSGAGDVLAVTLYPHWSATTTGSSWSDLRRAAEARGVPARPLERWGLHPGYLDLAAKDAQAAIDRVPLEHRRKVHVVFSAHGIPMRYVREGDPYADEVRATAKALAERIEGHDGWSLAFQSAVGPVEWLRPYTDQHVREHGSAWSACVVVPLGFVSDHIETLWDADVLIRDAARMAGVPFYTRAALFNDRAEFAAMVADLVQGAS